jgi:hypothetical protein
VIWSVLAGGGLGRAGSVSFTSFSLSSAAILDYSRILTNQRRALSTWHYIWKTENPPIWTTCVINRLISCFVFHITLSTSKHREGKAWKYLEVFKVKKEFLSKMSTIWSPSGLIYFKHCRNQHVYGYDKI